MLTHLLLLCVSLLILAIPASAADRKGLATIWQPYPYDNLEVFWIDDSGAIRWVSKDKNGWWHQAQNLTGPGVGVPGGAVTPVWQVQNAQLEVFWIGRDGAVNDIYKDHDGDWHAPIVITGPGFAPAGAPLTAFWQPVYHQLHVIGIAQDGSLSLVYKTDNGKWGAPFAHMTGPGFGVAGEKPTSIYQPTGGQSIIFATAPNGAINLKWKAYNEQWHDPFPITPPNTAPTGADLASVYMPPFDQLEVFFIGANGAANTVYRNGQNINAWKFGPITGPDFAVPGSSVTAAYTDFHQDLEVFALAGDGSVRNVPKRGNGNWQPALALQPHGSTMAGNTVSVVVEPTNNQLELIYQDAVGAVWDTWKANDGPWNLLRLTNPKGASVYDAAFCTAYNLNLYNTKGHPDAAKAQGCRPFAPGYCRSWRLTNPPVYIATLDDKYLLLGTQVDAQPPVANQRFTPIIYTEADGRSSSCPTSNISPKRDPSAVSHECHNMATTIRPASGEGQGPAEFSNVANRRRSPAVRKIGYRQLDCFDRAIRHPG